VRIADAAKSLIDRVDFLQDHGVVVPVLLAEEVDKLRETLATPIRLSLDAATALLELAQVTDPSGRAPEEQAALDYLADQVSAEAGSL
jgi:hypothetical protein